MSNYRIMSHLGGNQWYNEDGCGFYGEVMVDPQNGQLYLVASANAETIPPVDDYDDACIIEQDDEVIQIERVTGDDMGPSSWFGNVVPELPEHMIRAATYRRPVKYRSIDD